MRNFELLFGFCLLATAGCSGPLSLSQQLEGDWRGRPESAEERIEREWPRPSGEEEASPEADDLRDIASQPTDLEAQEDLSISLRFEADGKARLSLGDKSTLNGEWRLITAEGRKALVEIVVSSTTESDERRRFELEFQPDHESFVLREEGADKQFGRLLFKRNNARD